MDWERVCSVVRLGLGKIENGKRGHKLLGRWGKVVRALAWSRGRSRCTRRPINSPYSKSSRIQEAGNEPIDALLTAFREVFVQTFCFSFSALLNAFQGALDLAFG